MEELTPEQVVDASLALRRWAVVGASPKPERYSYKIVKLLRERGFEVFPVRPGLDEIEGLPVFPSVADVPSAIDVVDMVVNPDVGLRAMEQIRDAGIKYVWLQPGAESPEIHAFARAHGIHAIDACVLAVLSIRRGFRHG